MASTAETIKAAAGRHAANNPFAIAPPQAPNEPIPGIDMTTATAPKTTFAPVFVPAAKMPQRASHNKPPLDLDALEVEIGIPMDKRQERGDSKWNALFDRKLVKVGMSVLVPTAYQGGISAAALKRKKAGLPGTFKVARAGTAHGVKGIPDGTPVSRVGRVA